MGTKLSKSSIVNYNSATLIPGTEPFADIPHLRWVSDTGNICFHWVHFQSIVCKDLYRFPVCHKPRPDLCLCSDFSHHNIPPNTLLYSFMCNRSSYRDLRPNRCHKLGNAKLIPLLSFVGKKSFLLTEYQPNWLLADWVNMFQNAIPGCLDSSLKH